MEELKDKILNDFRFQQLNQIAKDFVIKNI